MRIEDFDYQLPPELIAQHPLPERDASRLLVAPRRGEFNETVFRELPQLLRPGDLLVVNDTLVRPLRVSGRKDTGGRVEFTLVKRLEGDRFECLLRGRVAPGLSIAIGEGVTARIAGVLTSEVRIGPREGAPLWLVEFSGDLAGTLERQGLPPLPPYIRRDPEVPAAEDRDRYQTVYAREGEAAAAPTAGFHFTPGLLAELKRMGVGLSRIRLDVSYGTFAPVREERVEDHVMHPERYELSEEAVRAVEEAKKSGGRVIAVGTTVTRTLEHCARSGSLEPGAGETSLYIVPGFQFRVVDALVTNFHLPRSTLLLLVAAFIGRERLFEAYRWAVERRFRFLSYGDAMFISGDDR